MIIRLRSIIQIRSLNGDRLVQDGNVQVSGDKTAVTGTISVENLLEEQTEYQLILQVTAGEQTSYYYTRIMEAGKSQIDACVDFVEEFHAITMNKERQSELSSIWNHLPQQIIRHFRK